MLDGIIVSVIVIIGVGVKINLADTSVIPGQVFALNTV